MSVTSNTSMPPEKGWPPPRQAGLFLAKSLRAVFELAWARKKFARLSVRQIQALNAVPGSRSAIAPEAASQNQVTEGTRASTVAWVAYVVPRIARAVPWRSDCLVQALAAQRWLGTEGIESEIVIGVERPKDSEFGAHAWLRCGDKTVTGGETDRYTIIL